MKKIIISVVLFIFVVNLSLAGAHAETISVRDDKAMPHYKQALILKNLGLFNGSEKGFELDRRATRIEAAVLLVRFLGAEKEALASHYDHPFQDVPSWADAHIGYMYYNGLTTGKSEDEFGSTDPVDSIQFMTFVLRALGYSDADNNFQWNDSLNAAHDWGIIGSADHSAYSTGTSFLRDDIVNITYKALNRGLKGQPTIRLINKLVDNGTISAGVAEENGFDTAKKLYTALDFGEINGIKPIDPSAFNMDIEQSDWRNKYTRFERNIRLYIDKSKLPAELQNYSILALCRNWKGAMSRDILAGYLGSKDNYRISQVNQYETDKNGWLLMHVGSVAYDVLLIGNSAQNISGYLALQYHFDADITGPLNIADRYELLDFGEIGGMKALKNFTLYYDSRCYVKMHFDRDELPEGNVFDSTVYNGVTQDNIIEYIEQYSKFQSQHEMDFTNDYNLPNIWSPYTLYFIYDANRNPYGYVVIHRLKYFMH